MRQATVAAALLVFALYAILAATLFAWTGAGGLAAALADPRTLAAARLSLLAAVSATALSFALALPAGYALSRYPFAGRALVDAILELPLVVSPIALGAALLLFFNTPTGRIIEGLCGGFVFAASGIVLAQFTATAGFATRLVKAAIDEVPPRIEAVAESLGATPLQAFLRVVLPRAAGGLTAALILTFAKCMGEFGATVTLAGTMPGRTETLPVSIHLRIQSFDLPGAAALILLLIALGLGVSAVARALTRGRHD